MDCKHNRIRCTDNRFFCMDCGAECSPPGEAKKDPVEPAPEVEKKPAKRRKKEVAE